MMSSSARRRRDCRRRPGPARAAGSRAARRSSSAVVAVVDPTEHGLDHARSFIGDEQLERHRANPVCAGCHRNIDPVGFALENFDAVGQWRTATKAGLPIDAAGVLADGTQVDGPVALRQALLARPEVFVAPSPRS